jgi:hypothetical protein
MFSRYLLRQSFVCVMCRLVARGNLVVCYVLLRVAAFVARCPAAILGDLWLLAASAISHDPGGRERLTIGLDQVAGQ